MDKNRLNHQKVDSSPVVRRATTWDIAPGSLELPLIIAHRGDVSTAPENTLPAFTSAVESGADGVELDVRLTRDEQLVVYHDRKLGRTSGGRGFVNQTTFDEMRSLDAGSWFGPEFGSERPPTLDEVFETVPKDFLVNVEMKAVIKGMRLIAHKVAEVVRRHNRFDSTLAASFNPIALWEIRKIDPRIRRGYIWSRYHPYPIRSRWFSPLVQAHWYDPANDTYDAGTMHKLRVQGAPTLAWDTDFGRDLALMASVKVDGVVTDALPEMLQQKRGWCPQGS